MEFHAISMIPLYLISGVAGKVNTCGPFLQCLGLYWAKRQNPSLLAYISLHLDVHNVVVVTHLLVRTSDDNARAF